MNLTIVLDCQSEIMPGSGFDVPGLVDLDVRHDRYGLPLINAKTIKGRLREAMVELIALSVALDGGKTLGLADLLDERLERLMGKSQPGRGSLELEANKLRFGDCTLPPELSSYLASAVEQKTVNADEMLGALTSIRSFTAMEDGVAKDGSLRHIRVFNAGLKLQCPVTRSIDLDAADRYLLAGGLRLMKTIGSMSTRGKGQVVASLYQDDQDITEASISAFLNTVGGESR